MRLLGDFNECDCFCLCGYWEEFVVCLCMMFMNVFIFGVVCLCG